MLASLVFAAVAAGQPLPTYSRPIRSFSEAEMAKTYRRLYQADMPIATGAEALKLSYPSPNSPRGHRRLSGALLVPTGTVPRGLVVFFHGTVVTDGEVPSRLPGHAVEAATPFLAHGFAVAMPDYVGQGDDGGRHPYPLGRINAWSGIDMVEPAAQVGRERGTPLEGPSFVSGYSEGGAVAMWAARHSQESPRAGVRFAAAAPLAGPYDLSGTTVRSIVSDQSNPTWRAARVFLVSYLGYGAEQWAPGVRLPDLFVPSFASYVPLVFQTAKKDQEIARRLAAKALQIRPTARSIRPILQPAALRALERGDSRHPLVRVLKANDCFDWAPQMPMRMVALERDFLVDPGNTRRAVAAMRARGVPESRVQAVILTDRLDHLTAAPKSQLLAAEFFAGLTGR